MLNGLLLCMLLSYGVAIGLVYYKYGLHDHSTNTNTNTNTISNVVCDTSIAAPVLLAMLIMGGFTLWYEAARGDGVSLGIMVALLVGLYGVICTSPTLKIHDLWALLTFGAIFAFMWYHAWRFSRSLLPVLVGLQALVYCWVLWAWLTRRTYFAGQCAALAVFATFFLYLHCLEVEN